MITSKEGTEVGDAPIPTGDASLDGFMSQEQLCDWLCISKRTLHRWNLRVAVGQPMGYSVAMSVTTTAHIGLDARGVAWIDDTNTKVVEVALDMVAHGWSPEEIHFQHPHLSLAQIHAALAYYYDHKTDLDAYIQDSLRQVERLRSQPIESPLRKRLREMGKLA